MQTYGVYRGMGTIGNDDLKESMMTTKVKAFSLWILAGFVLGMLPANRLCGADEDPAHPSHQEEITSASIQFILVYIERGHLDELMEAANVQTVDAIPLEKIGECVRTRDGAEMVSQIKLPVVVGLEAEMTLLENHHHKAKHAEAGAVEQTQRQTEVSVVVKAERCDGNRLAARFAYKRNVTQEMRAAQNEAEEEDSMEQKFDVSSGIVLQAGQIRLAGISANEDGATLLLLKASL